MKIYFLLGNEQKDIHETLNKIHIHFRGKEKFKSFYHPSEIFLDGEQYADIVEYTSLSKNRITAAFFDTHNDGTERALKEFLLSSSQKEIPAPDYCIVGGTQFEREKWSQTMDQICFLQALKIEGAWASYYMENLNRSIITDTYKNIFMGQIQKDFW